MDYLNKNKLLAVSLGVILFIGIPIMSLIYKMIYNLEMNIQYEALRTY